MKTGLASVRIPFFGSSVIFFVSIIVIFYIIGGVGVGKISYAE